MSAPQIPNLNTIRRGGPRGRGRGGGFGGGNRRTRDEIIQDTDNDAASSRLSAVEAGYLDDPFAALLTTNSIQQRLPLMNRGTYVRTTGIDRIVETFLLSHSDHKQIISLGAGSDTRYFRLKQKYSDINLVYHEIDFETNTRTKISHLKSASFGAVARRLCSIDVDQYETSDGGLSSPDYYIHAQDLRKLPESLPGVVHDIPTLLISECCLIYLSPDEADDALSYFTRLLSKAPLAIAIYEPIRPNDPFGRTMIRNLATRGIQLRTLEKYADLEQQRQRLRDLHLGAHAEDIDYIWRKWVNDAERERVEKLEWMDEVEEFVLLAKHYCVAWGWRGWPDNSTWENLPASNLHTRSSMENALNIAR